MLFLFFSALSQEPVLLKGKIIADSLEGSVINIVNLTQETGSVNNNSGEFEIEVKFGDTLYFSSVQYEGKEIAIDNEIINRKTLRCYYFGRLINLKK